MPFIWQCQSINMNISKKTKQKKKLESIFIKLMLKHIIVCTPRLRSSHLLTKGIEYNRKSYKKKRFKQKSIKYNNKNNNNNRFPFSFLENQNTFHKNYDKLCSHFVLKYLMNLKYRNMFFFLQYKENVLKCFFFLRKLNEIPWN